MTFLELERLEKTYPDGTRAVQGIDLAIERGQFVVLLGPSGCGKTTTLRMIAGLELATGGSIRLDGKDVTLESPARRDIGFVFQFYALYPHLTVAENIAFPLEASGVARADRERIVGELARRLELTDLLARRPRELSGGDQQRVALARAIVRKPAAWLMDEPLGTLDADRRLELAELIRARQLEQRVTTVYVTHDQEEALRLADRIVVMSDGRIVQDAAPTEVYDSPAHVFVARFVGSPGMNLIEGEVVERKGERRARMKGARDDLGLACEHRRGPITIGVRAEFVRLDPRGPIAGRVVADEYLGAGRTLHVETEAGAIVASVPPDAQVGLDQNVRLAFDGARVRWFDAESGARLS